MKKVFQGIIKSAFFPYFFLSTLVFAVYGNLFFGFFPALSDTFAYQMPEKFFLRESFRSGFIPFYNPYILCGIPVLENIDTGLFNPLNLLLLVGDFDFSYNLYVFMHYLLASWTMFFMLRVILAYPVPIALIGAAAYSCSGYLWGMTGNGFYRCAFIIPLYFSGVFHMLYNPVKDRDRKLSAYVPALTGIALALLFYCGNFFEAYFSVFFSSLCVLAFLCRDKFSSLSIKKTIPFCLSLVSGALIAAPQLLPSIIFSLQSYRKGGLPLIEAQQWSFPPVRIIELIIPFIFGDIQGSVSWHGNIYIPEETFYNTGIAPWTQSIYVGIPLLCGLVVFMMKGWRKERVLFASFIIFSFCVALGKFTPLYGIMHRLMPGFAIFRHPEKFIFWFAFWSIIAGCEGLKIIIDEKECQGIFSVILKSLIFTLGGSLIFFVLVFIMKTDAFARFFVLRGAYCDADAIFIWIATCIACSFSVCVLIFLANRLVANKNHVLWILLVVSSVNFAFWSHNVNWTVPVETVNALNSWDRELGDFDRRIWRVMASDKFRYPTGISAEDSGRLPLTRLADISSLRWNTPVLKGLMTPGGFSPIMEKRYIDFFNFKRWDPEIVASCLSVRFIGTESCDMIPESNLIVAKNQGKDYMILENSWALPRISVHNEVLIDETERLEKVFDPGRFKNLLPIVHGLPGNYRPDIKLSPNPACRLLESSSQKIELELDGPCWVIIRDWCLPGITCLNQNGEKIPVVKAEGGFCAVFLDAEKGKLTFGYFPPGLNAGMILLGFGFILLCTTTMFFRQVPGFFKQHGHFNTKL